MGFLWTAALGLFGLVVFCGFFDPGGLSVLRSQRYEFRERIDEIRPDLILVGNSLLWASIDAPLLETYLSERSRRPVKVLLLADGGTPASWMYLVLRRHVAASREKSAAVGVFSLGSSLVSSDRALAKRQLWLIYKLLTKDDDVFFRKTGVHREQLALLAAGMKIKINMAGFLTTNWTRFLLGLTGRAIDAEAVLNHRFGIRTAPSERVPLQAAQGAGGVPGCDDLMTCADRTFLPDMIEAMKERRFFLVEVHPRPGLKAAARAPRSLRGYLEQQRVPFISLADEKDLDSEDLFAIGHHLGPTGKSISTRLFAEAVLRLGLLPNSI